MSCLPTQTLQTICERFEGACALYISLPATNETFSYRADVPINAASTIKVPIMAALFQDAEEGRLALDCVSPLAPENRVRGTGVLKYLAPDVCLSLYDHAVLMTIHSDNCSTNHIIDAVGIDLANAFFAKNGWTATRLNKKLFVAEPGNPDGDASSNFTSARDLADMMEKILAGALVSQTASRKMQTILACQKLGKFSKAFPNIHRPPNSRDPLTPVPQGKVMMLQKGGTLTGVVSHEIAAMLLPDGQQAVLSMMTECSDKAKSLEAMKKVARAVYGSLR